MVRPLTKKDQHGKLYKRPLEIQTDIIALIQQDMATLRRRAGVSKRDSNDFIPMECLVHLIREARRRHDEHCVSILLPSLLARCEAMLIRKVPDSSRPDAVAIREEILSEFSLLFAEDGSGDNPDELDFFECRFNLAFRSFWINFMRRETARATQLVELPPENENPDSLPDEERLSRISDAFQQPATQLSDIYMEELLNAIDSLQPDERKAIVLCCVLEYKEESDNPSETTAATLCGVSGRTIRNRLSRAAKKLSKFNEEEK